MSELRMYYGVHTTREIVPMLEARQSAKAAQVRLSPRGREVFMLYMQGNTYKKISETLGISMSGVRRHRENMLWQNNCESMMELIARYHAQNAKNNEDV